MSAILNNETINKMWTDAIIPGLSDFVKIPSVSINYDHAWKENGHIMAAIQHCKTWAEKLGVRGLKSEVVSLDGYAPLLYLEIPASGTTSEEDMLFFGHLDKMPEGAGWSEGIAPWQPLLKNNRLYGRGAADNGFGFFASIGAIKMMQEQNVAHPRCVFLYETAEESGSPGFGAYIKKLSTKLGDVKIVVCLDSGCGDYKRAWCSYSCRGLVEGQLTIEMLEKNRHSGVASGILATPFRVLRSLLERVEDTKTGKIKLKPLLPAKISADTRAKIKSSSKIMGKAFYTKLGFKDKVKPLSPKVDELILNNSWMPTLCITGAEHLPTLEKASATFLAKVAVAFSVRLPPTCNTAAVEKALVQAFTKQPINGAKVTVNFSKAAPGWSMPKMAKWLEDAVAMASKNYFGAKAEYLFMGGTLGLLADVAALFPKAQFVLTGLQGFDSNEHGPDESLNLDAAKKITGFVAQLLYAAAKHNY